MRGIFKYNRRLAAPVMLLLLAGCATYGVQLRDVESTLMRGNTAQALVLLEALPRDSTDEALYLANKGLLQRLNGDIPASIATFESLKPLLEYQEATSISETAGQFAVTETSSSYQLRAFERLQVNVLQILNYLELGKPDAARVEALQTDLLLRRLYGDGRAPYGGDAFPRYLSGIVFELNGELDDALIAYRRAAEAYTGDATVRGVPDDLQRRLLWLTRRAGLTQECENYARQFGERRVAESERLPYSEKGELLVIAAAGLVPRKYEVSSLTQDPVSGKFFRISLPALRSRGGYSRPPALFENGELLARADPAENLARAAERTLEAEMPGLIARSLARNVVKNAVANQAGKESDGIEFLLNVVSAVLENADLRSWSTLPETWYVMRVPLESGKHDLQVGFDGRLHQGVPLRDVNIKAGETVVRSVHQLRP